MEEKMS